MSKDKDIKRKKEQIKNKSGEVISYYLREPYVPFGICIFLSLIMNVFIELDVLPWFISLYGGIALLLLSLMVFRWAIKHIRLNGEEWSPLAMETQSLIVFGPYHYSRNPIFISAIMLYLTLFIFLNNMWGFIFLIPLVKLLNKNVIKPREDMFLEEYGETYEDYHNKTGRWL